MAKKKFAVPPATVGDQLHAIARAGIGSVPVVGSAGVELFAQIIAPPLERRRAEWMEEVGDALRSLEDQRRITPEALSADEEFVDTVVQASQAATRTGEKEKRLALRNAVLNTALSQAPIASKRQLFLRFVDDLPVWSLRMLRLFADPLQWYQENGRQPRQFVLSSSLEAVLHHAFPELQSEEALCNQLMKGLYNEGLIGTGSLRVMMSADGAYQQHATELGNELLKFIVEPDGLAAE